MTATLYDGCPGAGGSVIPGTAFTFSAVPDDGVFHILELDPSAVPVTLPDTVWMKAEFSASEAAWIIAEQASTGTAENRYGWTNPWNHNRTLGLRVHLVR